MTTPGVVAVVLSYNGRSDTLRCLSSLERVDGLARTVVVDNGSTDGSVAAVRDEFPATELIACEQNLGFSAGNNAGIDRALELAADWVLILNNDTVVAPDALRRLLAAAAAHPRAGILSPVISFMQPDDLVWFGGARFDPARGRSGRMEHHRSRLPADSSVRTIDRATGAAMLVSRAAIEAVGVFDPDYFFLYEDVDLSLRVRGAGFDIVFVPSARVWHRVSATQGAPLTPTISYYGIRNNLMTCQRHAPLRGPAAWRRELACVATHVAGVRRARQWRTACLLALIAGWRDFHRRRFGPREAS